MKGNFKKCLSLLLSIVLVFSVFQATGTAFIAGAAGVESSAVTFEGAGTDASVIVISTADQLRQAIENGGGGKVYKLANDIVITDSSWLDTIEAYAFYGTLDGDYHTVSGLKYEGSNSSALIPHIQEQSTTIIKNLGIVNSEIKSTANAGALVAEGKTQSSLYASNIFIGSDVTVEGLNAGALLARGDTAYTVDRAYSTATLKVTGENGKSGFIGDSWSGYTKKISNSFVDGKVVDRDNNLPTYTNVYTSVDSACGIYCKNMQGKDALANGKMSGLAACGAFTATDSYPKLTAFMTEEEIISASVWDGTTDTQPSGLGTEESPYLITNGAELAWAVKNWQNSYTYFKLENDIYLNDTSKINWTDGNCSDSEPNQWYSRPSNESVQADSSILQDYKNLATQFYGELDGNYHTIYGMYYKGESFAGLIPMLAESKDIVIKNLGIDCAYINGSSRASAFVADGNGASSLTVEGCYVGKQVNISGTAAGAFYGFGAPVLTLKNSYSLGNVTGENKHFGLFGETWGPTRKIVIENAFNAGGPICEADYKDITDLKNVYSLDQGATYTSTSYRTAGTMQDKDALTNADKMSDLAACGAFTATAEYSKLTAFMTEEEIISASVWDGKTKTPPTGSGTEADPFIIANAENLAYVIENWYNDECFFKITADIYLNDISKINWKTGEAAGDYEVKQWLEKIDANTDSSASLFHGTIDGDYHTIYGMYYTGENFAGLLPMLANNHSTTVKNLGIDCAYIKSEAEDPDKARASAFIGDANDASSVTVEGCYVGEKVIIMGNNVGAFYGYGGAKFAINNCYSLATLSGTCKGLVGNIWGGSEEDKNLVKNTFTNTDIAGVNGNLVEPTNVYDGGYGKENMTGLGALTASTKMMNLGDAFVATVSYPVLKGFKYEPEYATVMLEADGGKLSEATVVGIVGSVAELPTPTKENYTFKGWYKDIALTIPADNVINSDCTYYAKWYMPYDVNKDNNASEAADLAALRKALLFDDYRESLTFSPDAADCNQDGNIDILDFVRLKKKSVGASLSGNIPEAYTLVWNDEFDGTAVSDKWGYKAHKISDVTSDSKKITVSDGVATFSLTEDTTAADGTKHYTFPSELVTDNTMNFKYGYVEVRAKLPFYGKGEFPAFWGLATGAELAKNTGSYKQADYNFELDIFENMSYDTKSIQSQIHLWNKDTALNNITGLLENNGYHGFEADVTDDWHIYGMLWTENKITFYVDGKVTASYVFYDNYKSVFNNYSDLILTLSYYTPKNVEGDSSRTAGTYFADGNTELTMQIDYVRLYQNRATDSILIK